jgi:hypothetical protein
MASRTCAVADDSGFGADWLFNINTLGPAATDQQPTLISNISVQYIKT